MEASSDRQALGTGRRHGMPAEFERCVDVHDVHTIEGAVEQCGARLGEMHLLLGRNPAHQRNVVLSGRIFGGIDPHQSNLVTLPFEFLRPLER